MLNSKNRKWKLFLHKWSWKIQIIFSTKTASTRWYERLLTCLFRCPVYNIQFEFFYANFDLPNPPSMNFKTSFVLASLLVKLSLYWSHRADSRASIDLLGQLSSFPPFSRRISRFDADLDSCSFRFGRSAPQWSCYFSVNAIFSTLLPFWPTTELVTKADSCHLGQCNMATSSLILFLLTT